MGRVLHRDRLSPWTRIKFDIAQLHRTSEMMPLLPGPRRQSPPQSEGELVLDELGVYIVPVATALPNYVALHACL